MSWHGFGSSRAAPNPIQFQWGGRERDPTHSEEAICISNAIRMQLERLTLIICAESLASNDALWVIQCLVLGFCIPLP